MPNYLDKKYDGGYASAVPAYSDTEILENKEKIIELLTEALQTDGAHHKQWYLNEVLKLIDKTQAEEVEGWTGDTGIAP